MTMTRPWIIWLVSATCALLVLGAMAVISGYTLKLENDYAQAEAEGELEERIRLAMWRLDTVSGEILNAENQRLIQEFEVEAEAESLDEISQLFYDAPSYSQLYYNVSPQAVGNKVTSPQVPVTDQLKLADDVQSIVLANQDNLNRLNSLLNDAPNQIQQSIVPYADNNLDLSCSVAHVALNAWEASANIQAEEQQQVASESLAQLAKQRNTLLNGVDIAPQAQKTFTEEESKSRRALLNRSVASSYDQVQQKVAPGAYQATKENPYANDIPAPQTTKLSRNMKLKGAPSSVGTQSKGKAVGRGQDGRSSSAKSNDSFSAQVEELAETAVGSLPSKSLKAVEDDLRAEAERKQEEALASIRERLPKVVEMIDPSELGMERWSSPFTPIWLGEELMLVRKVQSQHKETLQGVWLDAQEVQASLLSTIQGHLPKATLRPLFGKLPLSLGGEEDGSSLDLALLPFQLEPNENPTAIVSGLTPMRKSLLVAWIGAILALAAGWALLHGVMKLSERRASFVSSVTHELRTPLTTFKLYSELLSTGMVRDEEKQRGYLETLCRESDRLSHLVENVLSYSQIERGSARAKCESVSLESLLQRMEHRWVERGKEEGMSVNLDLPSEMASIEMNVDVTSVDQIMFNLIDNACKYGQQEGGGGTITVSAQQSSKHVKILVSDEGCGIQKKERKRLFKAFHKSATEAAHTKPGVGLGLALCRRLARALQGDLTIDFQHDSPGATFVLTLPR